MKQQNDTQFFARIMDTRLPDAAAVFRGGPAAPGLMGTASFWQTPRGVLVSAAVRGLPMPKGPCAHPVFALHIHAGGACTGTAQNPFADALGHYNPTNCPHPFHAGDLPPLFADKTGGAWLAVLTDRFAVRDIMGKTVVIHSKADDFTTQPSGNPGSMLACGVVSPVRR